MQKKWFYFNLMFVSCELTDYLLGTILKNGFSIGMICSIVGVLIITLLAYVKWNSILIK